MTAMVLMCSSAAILLILGSLHLIYTFHGNKLTPRDPALLLRMQDTQPVITRHTTMWKAWVGFNASHSMGAMLFGLVYGYLAMAHTAILFGSPFLLGVGLLMLGGFLALGLRYWFRIPIAGTAIALGCYLSAIALS
jgi:hypothetical protein